MQPAKLRSPGAALGDGTITPLSTSTAIATVSSEAIRLLDRGAEAGAWGPASRPAWRHERRERRQSPRRTS